MAKAKHNAPSRQNSTKRICTKPVTVLIALVLLLTAGIGGTVAYITTISPKIETVFVPTDVDCEIQDDFTVKNTGSNNAYIRVAAVQNYVAENGHVCAKHSVPSLPTVGDDWELKGGYYYYIHMLAPDHATSPLFNFFSSTDMDGCKLQLELFASAIQAEPTDVVIKVWGYTPYIEGAEQ